MRRYRLTHGHTERHDKGNSRFSQFSKRALIDVLMGHLYSLQTENNTHPKTRNFIYAAAIQVFAILVLRFVSQVH